MSVESALKSLYAAVISQYEIIIVNDGITDGTYDIVKSMQKINNKIRFIKKSNGGYGSAINSGLSRAKSNYISILDSDDVCIAGAYEAAISALEQDPKIDLTRHPYIEWHNGKLQKSVGIPNPSPQIQTAVENPQLLYMAPAIWSAVYRLADHPLNIALVIPFAGPSVTVSE